MSGNFRPLPNNPIRRTGQTVWYFGYGADLSWRNVIAWCRKNRVAAPRRGEVIPAVLPNHRLCFPLFDPHSGGGAADIAPAFGKSVYGALFELDREGLDVLAAMNGAPTRNSFDDARKRAMQVEVTPLRRVAAARDEVVAAMTFVGVDPEVGHVPPAREYLQSLIDSAVDLNLSAMWVMYLRSLLPPVRDPATRGTLIRSA
jgi:hypothetical protein